MKCLETISFEVHFEITRIFSLVRRKLGNMGAVFIYWKDNHVEKIFRLIYFIVQTQDSGGSLRFNIRKKSLIIRVFQPCSDKNRQYLGTQYYTPRMIYYLMGSPQEPIRSMEREVPTF